jgi:hypothetical protein
MESVSVISAVLAARSFVGHKRVSRDQPDGRTDHFRLARDSGGIPRTRYDLLRTRSLLRIGE